MSKVYSFRLSDDNPREAQAREVIEAWVEEGFSLRYVITEGLLRLLKSEVNQIDIEQVIDQIKSIAWEWRDNPKVDEKAQKERFVLSDTFVRGVKKSVQSGTRTM